jgi:arsenate reductase-like glutaredoxin family protein
VRTQGFLAARKVVFKEEVWANKSKIGAADALKLARASTTVIAAKGKKVVTFDLKKDQPSDEALLAVLLGPTGNLRAPTLKKGPVLLVGFDEETYRRLFD